MIVAAANCETVTIVFKKSQSIIYGLLVQAEAHFVSLL